MSRSFRAALSVASCLGLASAPSMGFAALPCSFERSYPEVTRLDIVDGRLVATLGGRFAAGGDPDAPMHLALDSTATWAVFPGEVPADGTSPEPPQCPTPPVDADWVRSHGMNPAREIGFRQSVTACVSNADDVWGALAFSSVDGPYGGALFSQDSRSGHYDFWRPLVLTQHSVSHISFAADSLWLGIVQEGECIGPAPGFGIYRIDVLDDRRRDYAYPVTDVCGFAARDMATFEGAFWVATELGLARLEEASAGEFVWQNYMPDTRSAELMRPMSCDEIYEAVLNMPHMFTDEAFDLGIAFDDFWARLSSLRPQFVATYLRKLHGR